MAMASLSSADFEHLDGLEHASGVAMMRHEVSSTTDQPVDEDKVKDYDFKRCEVTEIVSADSLSKLRCSHSTEDSYTNVLYKTVYKMMVEGKDGKLNSELKEEVNRINTTKIECNIIEDALRYAEHCKCLKSLKFSALKETVDLLVAMKSAEDFVFKAIEGMDKLKQVDQKKSIEINFEAIGLVIGMCMKKPLPVPYQRNYKNRCFNALNQQICKLVSNQGSVIETAIEKLNAMNLKLSGIVDGIAKLRSTAVCETVEELKRELKAAKAEYNIVKEQSIDSVISYTLHPFEFKTELAKALNLRELVPPLLLSHCGPAIRLHSTTKEIRFSKQSRAFIRKEVLARVYRRVEAYETQKQSQLGSLPNNTTCLEPNEVATVEESVTHSSQVENDGPESIPLSRSKTDESSKSVNDSNDQFPFAESSPEQSNSEKKRLEEIIFGPGPSTSSRSRTSQRKEINSIHAEVTLSDSDDDCISILETSTPSEAASSNSIIIIPSSDEDDVSVIEEMSGFKKTHSRSRSGEKPRKVRSDRRKKGDKGKEI